VFRLVCGDGPLRGRQMLRIKPPIHRMRVPSSGDASRDCAGTWRERLLRLCVYGQGWDGSASVALPPPVRWLPVYAKILSIVAVSGLLVGSTALVQAQQTAAGQRTQRGESRHSGAMLPHETQKRGGIRGQRDTSRSASGRTTRVGAGDDKTTGFGGRGGDEAFASNRDDRSGDQEGHLRGDRASGMMDNVRRDDGETSE
jgi:hypothetical protein